MPYYFGDWIREQRTILQISQAELSNKTNNVVKQSTISMWESGEIRAPSLRNIWTIAKSLGIPLSNIPWDYLDFGFDDDVGTRCNGVKERFSLYELPKAESVRTFDGKTYKLKGFIGVEQESGEVKHITDLYYRTRTVVSDSKVLAKRKGKDSELMKVEIEKKLKAK